MKLQKFDLGYNTRDQLRSLAISASERNIILLFFQIFKEDSHSAMLIFMKPYIGILAKNYNLVKPNYCTGCPKKKYPNLVDPSDKHIA